MAGYLIQITVKILFTGILLLIIAICALEIWRVRFDRTFVLVPFGYIRNVEPVREVGKASIRLTLEQFFRMLSREGATISLETDVSE